MHTTHEWVKTLFINVKVNVYSETHYGLSVLFFKLVKGKANSGGYNLSNDPPNISTYTETVAMLGPRPLFINT